MRAEAPLRSSTVVFAGICLFAVMLALVAPTWIRVAQYGADRLTDRFSETSRDADGAMLDGVFTYQQQRSLSCEYASLHIATSMLGDPVSEYVFDELVPLNDNPHLGYRGNILGDWGNTTDYGVYNEPLASALSEVGFRGNAFYGDINQLRAELDQGHPVVVWLGFWGDSGSFDAWSPEGQRFQLTPGMHVLVVYGYDEATVYLTDPGTGILREYGWPEFQRMWAVMDEMALSVSRL